MRPPARPARRPAAAPYATRAVASYTSGPSEGNVYSAAAQSLFARFTTPPTTVRKTLINNLIVSLVDAGVWAKLDAFYMLAAADAQSSLLNWVFTSYTPTAVNSPAFVVDQGYTGNGSTSYLDTGFNPTTASSPKFVQDSAHQALWSRTNLANGAGVSSDMGNVNSHINRHQTTAGLASGRPNAGSGLNYAPGSYPGYAAWTRSAAAVWEAYAQGVDGGGGTNASAAPTNATFRVCAGNGFGVNQIAAAHFGSNLTASEMLAAYNALAAYLVAIGAA